MHNGQKGRVRGAGGEGRWRRRCSLRLATPPRAPRSSLISNPLYSVPLLLAACAPSPSPPSHFRPVEAAAGRGGGGEAGSYHLPAATLPRAKYSRTPAHSHPFSALCDHYPLGRVYMTGSELGLAGDLGALSHQRAWGRGCQWWAGGSHFEVTGRFRQPKPLPRAVFGRKNICKLPLRRELTKLACCAFSSDRSPGCSSLPT